MHQNLANKASNWKFKIRKLWSIVWPINWANFQKVNLVVSSIQNTGSKIKGVLIICLVGFLVSVIFLLQGFYLVLTVETANTGGEINEAIFSQSFSNLNPVLPLKNDTERQIVDLIYHPLYKVQYPDFLNSQQPPKIQPILLKQEPQVIESNGEKSIDLELLPNLKWSDGSNLTSEDVQYTFNLLKEKDANPDFRDVFADYKITTNSATSLNISAINKNKGFSSQLKYLANFYPISKKYFESLPIDAIAKSPKSLQNSVTSGLFIIPPLIKLEGKDSNNPVADPMNGYNTIVLEKNPQNSVQKSFLQRYIIKIYEDLIDVPGAQNNSIQRASTNKKVDIFSRFLSTTSNISPSYITEKFGLNQKVLPTNTYYITYANTQSGQWLINQNLRKYVMCSMQNFKLEQSNWAIESIASQKQFVPIQLGTDVNIDCSTSKDETLSQKNKNGTDTYVQKDGKILLDEKTINLNILLLQENDEIGKTIAQRLQDIGVDSNFTFAKDMEELDSKIADKAYNLVLLPTTIISQDLYPMYGAKSRNISNINKNNRFGVESENFGEGIELNLKQYSDSGLEDKIVKQKLNEFFRNEYISVNLFRVKKEINYSDKLYVSDQSFDNSITFAVDLYNKLPTWYTETRRKFRWF